MRSNNQGYLDETLDEILEAFDPELDIELDEIEAVLHPGRGAPEHAATAP